MVTDDIDKAIDGVHLYHPGYSAFAHGDYARLLKAAIKKDQIIVVSLRFRRLSSSVMFFGRRRECPVIADVNNLPYDTRLWAPGKVSLFGRNKSTLLLCPPTPVQLLLTKCAKTSFPSKKSITTFSNAACPSLIRHGIRSLSAECYCYRKTYPSTFCLGTWLDSFCLQT
jgi:opine dehydrogenase